MGDLVAALPLHEAGQWLSQAAAWLTAENLFEVLVGYWFVLKILLIVTAVIILVSSIDDLIIDAFYWDLAWREHWKRLWKRPPSHARMVRRLQTRIAVMVPAWQEAEVIAAMVANTVNTFDYDNFDIFVGVYQNDPETQAELAGVQARFPNVHKAMVPRDGPTSKADCLNCIIQNIRLYEAEHGVEFGVFLMHDAEDVVHPFGLRTVNWFINGHGMIQMPVLSMNRRWFRLVACHYMDEFAEFHGKDLRVRSDLARMTPSAGVATAFRRDAILKLCEEKNDQPFNTDSLTEDYDVGHRLRALGFSSAFIRYYARTRRWRKAWFRKGQVPVWRKELVATKEFFPDRWGTAVRQKARWMLGISYMGWKQLGWFGDAENRYFLFRDRKALITAPVGALAYLIVLQYLGYVGVAWIFPQVRKLPPLIDQEWVWAIIYVNFFFLLNRIAHRFWFTWRYHGLRYAWLSPVRIVVSNLIGFGAFYRSMKIFTGHLATGKTIAWDKTKHAFPSLAQIAHRRGLLGDVLRFWNHVEVADLDAALKAQKQRYRPIGLLLLDRGSITDVGLAEAFAETRHLPYRSFDPLAVRPEVLNLLTPAQAARFGAVPVDLADGRLEVALAEPLDRADQAELERLLARSGAREVAYVFAPLGDVAFAVRFGWTPAALDRARALSAELRRQELLDPAAEARLWRAIRADWVRLGDLAVRLGMLDHRQLSAALADFVAGSAPFGEFLVGRGLISRADLDRLLARQKGSEIDVLSSAVSLGLIGSSEAHRLRDRSPEPV
jgi:adsorption protein B